MELAISISLTTTNVMGSNVINESMKEPIVKDIKPHNKNLPFHFISGSFDFIDTIEKIKPVIIATRRANIWNIIAKSSGLESNFDLMVPTNEGFIIKSTTIIISYGTHIAKNNARILFLDFV